MSFEQLIENLYLYTFTFTFTSFTPLHLYTFTLSHFHTFTHLHIYTLKKQKSKTYDYIIVGHGIAGSMMGYFLEQSKQRCLYIDAPQQTACSSVAAGIINPITGRKYVKSWMVDKLIPFAQQTYRALEKELGFSFFHPYPLVRSLFSAGDENTWLSRFGDADYLPYLSDHLELGAIDQLTKPVYAYAQIQQTAQVHIGKLCQALKDKHRAANCLLEEEFDFESLELQADSLTYKGIQAHKIIFCEGWRSRFNPYFNHLPFRGNKGEVFHIRLPEGKIDRMFKHHLFIVPFGEDTYWVGGTSKNYFEDEQPSQDGRSYLLERLEQVVDTPYEIIGHYAAVRPTVKDRRPFIGLHPQFAQLAIFNGMGTKGTSLSPYWAQHFVTHLLEGQALNAAVDIERFG